MTNPLKVIVILGSAVLVGIVLTGPLPSFEPPTFGRPPLDARPSATPVVPAVAPTRDPGPPQAIDPRRLAADPASFRGVNVELIGTATYIVGVSLLPSVRATWAPRGQTPVLHHPFNWKRLSLAAALVYEADARDAHLVFELRPGAYNGESLIEFLTDLHHLEPGRRMVLLWDGLPAHRSRCMTDWIDTQRAWLSVARLPAYAPQVNPTEQVFGNLKSTELANLCRHSIGEVQAIAEDGLDRIGSDTQLCFAFLRHSGLNL